MTKDVIHLISQKEVLMILERLIAREKSASKADYLTLHEQICALFFTNTVSLIDVAYFTDFLIVLMSTRIESEHKITLLLKTIQDCLECAKTGKTEVIRLASQRLFELTLKTQNDLTGTNLFMSLEDLNLKSDADFIAL